MDSEISRLSNLLTQTEADFKAQYQTLRANFNQAEQQNANLTNILEQNRREYTQNIELLAQELNREKEISQMANGLNTEYQKSVEIIQVKQNELVEISKKLKDYEFQVGQKTAEINRLKLLDEDYQKILENQKKGNAYFARTIKEPRSKACIRCKRANKVISEKERKNGARIRNHACQSQRFDGSMGDHAPC